MRNRAGNEKPKTHQLLELESLRLVRTAREKMEVCDCPITKSAQSLATAVKGQDSGSYFHMPADLLNYAGRQHCYFCLHAY